MSNQTKISISIFGIFVALIVATTISVQSASATSATQGASNVAPGHLKTSEEDSQSANTFAPGIIQGRLPGGGCDAPSFAPGHVFRQQTENP